MHRTTAQDAKSHCSPVSRTMHLVTGIIAPFRVLHAQGDKILSEFLATSREAQEKC
jgi:hypothetical protein